jgi:predicted RNA-binding protein YlxR (DUF448 family)
MLSQQSKRIPTRTCVICRKRRERGELLRIVRTPTGDVEFDSTGRMDGRGAYVCGDAAHWGSDLREISLGRGRISNALKTEIDDSILNLLGEAIRSHLSE